MAHSTRARVNAICLGLFKKYHQRLVLRANPSHRTYATREIEDDLDSPIKFTTSRANFISARASREQATDDTPVAQSISLMISLGAFLIYFGALREENDIDDQLSDSLFDKVPGIENIQKEVETRKGREIARQSLTS